MKNSYLTVTDQFCGAGGSSIGAEEAGLEVRMAMNHWPLAVETHNTNFPNADHDCVDVSASDPRRYPSTDILITSPECTTHSPAGGNRHQRSPQRDFFVPTDTDPATQRSRATMWDVVRFTEYHKYRAIIVENVLEVLRWELFGAWWSAMEMLGYRGQVVCMNSMFAHPTPQSRDRVYIVWTRRGNRKPDLNFEMLAPCPHCGDRDALQTWKNGRTAGKYGARNQYIYTCGSCRAPVTPYYFCALNAIDFTIPAKRIGDRPVPLRPRTLGRVRYGLGRYGRRPLQVTTNQLSGVACRVRGVDDPLFSQTTSNTTAVCSPFLYVARENSKAKPIDGPVPALVASANQIGIVQGTERFTPFIATNRTNAKGRALDDALPTMATGYHHAIVQPSALVRLVGDRAVSPLDQVLPAQTTGASQNLLVSAQPFLVQYYGTGKASSVDSAVPSISTKARHGLVQPSSAELNVDDCYFRMMIAREIGGSMAFPDTYVVLGTNGQQIKQYGNAVTPPAMNKIIRRVVASLHPELAVA